MVSRRTLLQAVATTTAAVPVLTSCTSGAGPGPAATGSDDAPAPWVAAELRILAAYDAYLRDPDAEGRKTVELLRAQHAEHLAALGAEIPGGRDRPASRSLPQLVTAQKRAARAQRRAAAAATDAEEANLLAVIAASEAQHVAVLEQL